MISLLKRQWKFLLIQNSSQPLTNGPRANSRDTLLLCLENQRPVRPCLHSRHSTQVFSP